MPFTVTYAERDGGGTCLRLTGELDMSTAEEFNAAVDRLTAAGERRLLVDLTELTFCDSTGIAAFLRGDHRAAAEGGWLRLTGASGAVDRVLRLTGVAQVLAYDARAGDPAPRAAP
ncbi:STAS domain-containing protein [Micromonospora globbae]|uniref:Anti-sigma factor antagonist n=1 Tax=Micromonospora globbae TaxID=1894969 RepID=A0A420F7U3_9ACTN|nr:STAS domain-containing protein [Micromonospora globbae]RKF28994.1 anti-sigma factor antagonist [Micromonospora globbae]WTF83906.1 STAS domain-containing protein [Micromonospora globbae]